LTSVDGSGVPDVIMTFHEIKDLPFPLRHPKVLGHAMLVAGAKPAG
jgi:hypothetical protein